MDFKKEKILDELVKVVNDFIKRESNHQSMITITRTDMTNDFKKAFFFVTVFPEHKEAAAIDFLKRNRGEIRDHMKKSSRLSRLPRIDFEIDKGEKARLKLDNLDDLDLSEDNFKAK